MSNKLSLLRRDIEDGLSSGWTKSMVQHSSQFEYQIIVDGVSRNSTERLAPTRVNSNKLYIDALAAGDGGRPNLTLQLLEIGWANFARLREISSPNPFESVYTTGGAIRTDANHVEFDEAILMSFLVWFVEVLCEDERFRILYMVNVNYIAKERRSIIEFEFAAQDPGMVGLIVSHGRPVPSHLLT